MNNSNNKKTHKRLLIVLLLVAITAGGVSIFSMLGKSQEERRNREYEVSLVNALKNSYEGIEEVHITDPSYASIPSDSWGAKVKIFFSDSKQLSYIIAFNKQNNEIRSRDFQNNSRKDDNQYLINHRGITEKNVKVIYSNGETGEQ
ncbi:hypothetical protein [Streptococcus oralis]|jgi:hypothetical protein|uniref:Uncharacterized protein n=1 Tax=Streptococcus oralis subsp. oralis TaxID=1891914 RepID=A0A1X1IBH9_STROR|nr:hypothetical protein [Streptococcus oralis]MBA1351241.1 hypothetical protein [Streptococcus oralis subsp. oralis]MBK3299270.1 hypothetical protein [Streptococcus oralis]MBT3114956.1 hypothetical protein [Streptococcus oralis]MBU6872918.1 hypothetical protein [Streptococcus oralis]MCY7073730.1 hypothetical protein [Streptococcus oralis]